MAAQDAFVFSEGSEKAYQVNEHVDSKYDWAVYTQLNPLVAANASATTITGNGSSQINIIWNLAGEYFLLVTETDYTGCTNTKAIRISVLPDNSTLSFTNTTSSACYQASNDFTIPVQFLDGSDLPVSASHFPMEVLYQLDGSTQSPQSITFANQNLAISGSLFTANSNSVTQVVLKFTGATDNLKSNLQSVTISAQNIHTHTIFRKLTAPTVASLITSNVTPTLSGTAMVGANETFKVSVYGSTYFPGDGNLVLSGTDWTLRIPALRTLKDGTYNVVATVSNASCKLQDVTTNELIIDTKAPAVPTVISKNTNDTSPVIAGTATVATGEIFTVKVNGITYTIAGGQLTLTGTSWSLQIPAGNELPDGVYELTATVTDAAGNSSTDATTNELVIDTKTIVTDRLATNDVNVTFKDIPVSGNVLTNDAGFNHASPTVTIPSGSAAANGTVTLNANGTYTYQSNAGFTGVDNFYYTVCTVENPADCETVNVKVRILDDELSKIPPVAINDEMQSLQNTAVSGNLMANDLSVSGEELILNMKLKEEPKYGKVVLSADGTYVYTPATGFVGQDYFKYEIYGAISGASDVARVTITVSADPLEVRLFAADDVFFSYGKPVQGNLLANDLIPSATSLKVSTTPVVKVAHGTVVVNSSGTFSYTPVSGFVGTDQFVYEICDSKLPDCDNATVYLVVKAPPALYADLSIVKTGPLSAVPGETVNYTLAVSNLGTATAEQILISDFLPAAIEYAKFNISGSTVSKDWEGFYDLAELKTDEIFTLYISGTVAANAPNTLKNVASVSSSTWDPVMSNNSSTINTEILRGPVARIAGAPSVTVGSCNEKGQILDGSASSGEGLTYSWSSSDYPDDPTSQKLVVFPEKTTSYTLTVTDNTGRTDQASVLVTVADAPRVILDNRVFVEAPNSTIMLDGSASTGTGLTYLWLSPEGSIQDGTTSMATVSGQGMYYLKITDEFGCIANDSVMVGLYILAINDASETQTDESVTINVARNDIPANSVDPSSISIVTAPLHGFASVSLDSLISYRADDDYVGPDEFEYKICDYSGVHCDEATVLVLVNDFPLFIPDAFSPNGDGLNDEFEMIGIRGYKNVEIEIFNRWGNIVFQSKNYGRGQGQDGFWDGTVRSGLGIASGPVADGTYFYVLKLNAQNSINGSVYLGR